jgi:hypothetical protein
MGARRQSWGISIWPIFMVEPGSGPGDPIYTGRDHDAADRALGPPARWATLWNLYQFGLRPIGTEKGLCVSYALCRSSLSTRLTHPPLDGSIIAASAAFWASAAADRDVERDAVNLSAWIQIPPVVFGHHAPPAMPDEHLMVYAMNASGSVA